MLLVVGDHTNVLIRLSKPEQWLFGMSIQYLQQENNSHGQKETRILLFYDLNDVQRTNDKTIKI